MTNYYIHRNGRQEGPYNVQTLRTMNLDNDTHVWCAGMPNWLPISQVPELQQQFHNSNATIIQPPPIQQQAYQQQAYQQQAYQQQAYQQQAYQQQAYQQQAYQQQAYQQPYNSENNDNDLSVWGFWKKCFQNFANFNGRARRKEYWSFTLVNFLIYIAVYMLSVLLIVSSLFTSDMAALVGILIFIYALVVMIPGLAVASRRLHDIGKGAGWIFISLVPFVGAIIFLVFAFTDSERGENRFGPNPKGL